MRHAIFALIRKDLLLETRGREAFSAMTVFAIMSIVMLNFALRLRADDMRLLAPGVLWVTLVFAGTLGLSRSMAVEQLNMAIEGILLAPHDRALLFIGKAITNIIFMLAMAAVAWPITAILFDERLFTWGVLLAIVIGIIGYAAAGTLIAAMAISTRSREVFLPILLFPLVLPMVIAAVLVTAGFVDHADFAEFSAWLGMLVAFAIIFWAAGALFFDVIVEG